MLQLPDELQLRDFDAAKDDAACKELEVTASQFQALGGSIKAAIVHHGGFDAKPRQFADHLLLVVVDEANKGAVCGVVCVGIKRAYVHGALQLCGMVFDLRVSEQYQRRGIGAALTTAAEERAAQRGVTFFYLSVNNDNRKARALYASQGWNKASGRALVFTPLLWIPSADSASASAVKGAVVKIERTRALKMVRAHYATRDLGLSTDEFARLFESEESYLGTYVAEDGAGSRAALSLWHGSRLTAFTPVHLLLPVAWWSTIAPALGALAVGGAAYAVRALLASSAGTVARAALAATLAAVVCGAVGFGRWIRSRTAFRARAFAPCWSGPKWEPLMRAVNAHVNAEARALGFGVIVINEDAGSPLVRCLYPRGSGRPRSPTAFWQKRLPTPPVWSDESALPTLYPDAFFDPRDM